MATPAPNAAPAPAKEDAADRRRLRARYRADARFKWYGIAALALAILFLFYFLYDIVSRGYTAFIQHEVRATLVLTEPTFEGREPMVRGIDPAIVSEAALLELRLAISRYEIQLPVRIDQQAVTDPARAIRDGVRLTMDRELATLREELQMARQRGDDRAVRRLEGRIEQIETSGQRLIEDAPPFFNHDRLSELIEARLETQGEADTDADDPRVELMWAPLSEASSRFLLDAPTTLSGAEQERLQSLVFRHFGRFADEYYRRLFDADAVGGDGEREQWITVASSVDLLLKDRANRLSNNVNEYTRLSRLVGVEPAAEPDAFEVFAAGLRAQREQARDYRAMLEELGIEPTAEPSIAAVLHSAAARAGDGRSLEQFRQVAEQGGDALREAVVSVGLPPRHAEAPMRLLSSLVDEVASLEPVSADRLRLMAENYTHWHDASEQAVAFSEHPDRLRETALAFQARSEEPRHRTYAEVAGFLGVFPVAEPEPLEIFAAALRSLDPTSRRAEDLETLAESYALVQEVLSLREAGRTRAVFNVGLFTNTNSRQPETAGLWNAIVGSVFLLLTVLLVAFPIGVLTAVYLEEFAPDNWFTRTIEVNINNLAAVPSILFGLLGLAVFINLTGWQRSAVLAGGLTLSLMSLPVIIIATRAALSAVPDSIRKGAQAMGATRWQTVIHHVLPLALPGILTGTIIALAQAIGETAPLLIIGMVGFIVAVPSGPLDPTTALPAQIYTWFADAQSGFSEKAAAGIIVLLVVLLSMNALAILLRAKFEKKW